MPAADRINSREGDPRPTTPDAAHRIINEEYVPPHNTASSTAARRAENAAHSSALVQSHVLPELHISGHTQPTNPLSQFIDGTTAVTGDYASGAIDALTHHPIEAARDALASVGTVAAVGTIGVLASPEIAAGLTGAAVLVGAQQVAAHGGEWIHTAQQRLDAQGVLLNPGSHTPAAVAAAHRTMHNAGRDAVLPPINE